MTSALAFHADGEVRHLDLDLERADLLHSVLGTGQTDVFRLPELGCAILYDELSLVANTRLNLPVSLLLYGSRRRPLHPLHGPVLIVGLTGDDLLTDVPDDLLHLFDTTTPTPQETP
jgi:hypothetical protein